MNTPNNQRSKITKILFHNSIIALLLEGKNIDSITITDICKGAELNRCTFYNHYQVPKDILDEIEQETYEEFISYLEALNQNDDIEKLTELLKFIRTKKDIYRVLLISKENTAFAQKIVNAVLIKLSDIDQYIIDKRLSNYLYGYIIRGSQDIIVNWIDSNFDVDEVTLANMIYKLSKKSIEAFAY